MEANEMEKTTIIPTDCRTQEVPIDAIKVLKRIRKNVCGIEALTEDIRHNGLINPPTVLDNGDATYTLITGLRRLRACQQLDAQMIRVTILTAIEADDMLALEFAENEQRQNFTTAERLEYAEKIKEIERRRGRERMSLARRTDHESGVVALSMEGVDHGPHLEAGKARDIIAQKTGFKSGRQYERVAKIADARPDLLEKIDSGEMSVRQAFSEAFPSPAAEDKSEVIETEGPLPSNVLSFSARRGTLQHGETTTSEPYPSSEAPSGQTAIMRSELEEEASADALAYQLAKAYTKALSAVIQLETTPEAVREWIRFSRMNRDEIKGTLMDINFAIDHLGKLKDTLSGFLAPQQLR